MASEDNNFTPEFKAKVALEALAQKKQNLDRLSDKHDVPVSTILTWTVQIEKNADRFFSDTETDERENVDAKVTGEFKAEVALEALTQKKQNLEQLSDKYDIPVSKIQGWMEQIENNAVDIFPRQEPEDTADQAAEEQEVVEVDVTDENVAESLSYGVMGDKLNYKRLSFWSVLGTVLALIFVIGLIEMYEYSTQITRERISAESEYYEVNQINREAEETLSSFGVVDLEEGIYRIPIDSAINELAVDSNN